MRVRRQSQSAEKVTEDHTREFLKFNQIAAWLDSSDGGRRYGVTKVHHPSLLKGSKREVAKKQMPGGFGGVLSFELDSEVQSHHGARYTPAM